MPTSKQVKKQQLACEDTLARARSQHNFGLIVELGRRIRSLEAALDATCKVLAERDRGSELSAK